jgi:hypothetical protein
VALLQRYGLAAALGLKGELDEAAAALAEGIELIPELNSLARLRAYLPYAANLPRGALREETVEVGLRNAGMSEGVAAVSDARPSPHPRLTHPRRRHPTSCRLPHGSWPV